MARALSKVIKAFLLSFTRFLCSLNNEELHNSMRDSIKGYLRNAGFEASIEYCLDISRASRWRYDIYQRRVDVYAKGKGIEVFVEVEHSQPRDRNVLKAFRFPSAYKFFILRGQRINYAGTSARLRGLDNFCVIDTFKHGVCYCKIREIQENFNRE